jgi:hypothetical protein
MKSHREQALLAPSALDERADVEKGLTAHASVHDDANPARALDDVEPTRLGARRGQIHRLDEAAGDADDPQLRPVGDRTGDGRREQEGSGDR